MEIAWKHILKKPTGRSIVAPTGSVDEWFKSTVY